MTRRKIPAYLREVWCTCLQTGWRSRGLLSSAHVFFRVSDLNVGGPRLWFTHSLFCGRRIAFRWPFHSHCTHADLLHVKKKTMRQHEPGLAPVSFHWVRNSNKSSISSHLTAASVKRPSGVFDTVYTVLHNYRYKLICETRLFTGAWHSFRCCVADVHRVQPVQYNSHRRVLWDSSCTQR